MVVDDVDIRMEDDIWAGYLHRIFMKSYSNCPVEHSCSQDCHCFDKSLRYKSVDIRVGQTFCPAVTHMRWFEFWICRNNESVEEGFCTEIPLDLIEIDRLWPHEDTRGMYEADDYGDNE